MTSTSSGDIRERLGVGREGPQRWRRRLATLVGLLVVIVVLAGVTRSRSGGSDVQYQTAMVSTGSLTVRVTATGSLESVTEVKVGTEISGVVERVDADYNTAVKVGQLLASINTDKLRAQRLQAQGAVDAGRAKELQTKATVAESRAQLGRLRQVRELSGGKVPSQQELDTQEATVQRAEADLASAAAQVTQATASLAAIDTDIRKAEIRSPINGIVLDRQVDPGQTVAASFQTPTLFTLAEDLTRMKLVVAVDEADVGSIRVGQPATFRVDAYADRRFDSRVTDVRSTPKTSNGVVTYQTVLAVDNHELLLKPGMTATADVTVAGVTDVALVPNAALRFTPPQTTESSGGLLSSLIPRPPATPKPGPTNADKQHQRVWMVKDQQLTPIEIAVGMTDGRSTQIISGDMKAGMSVVTDTISQRK
jgi:HlyD family secretion protein